MPKMIVFSYHKWLKNLFFFLQGNHKLCLWILKNRLEENILKTSLNIQIL